MTKYFYAILVLPLLGGQAEPDEPVKLGHRILGSVERSLGDLKVTIKLSMHPYSWRNGTTWANEQFPGSNTLIDSVDIKFPGLLDKPWRSAFLDLADITEVHLKGKPHNAHLILTGGNDGGSYTARIWIRNGKVVARRVVLNTFPDELHERTDYASLPIGDDH